MAGVLFVGMFNRETLGFLLVLWTLEHWLPTRSRAQTARLLMLAAVCVGVYFGIRWARGFETYRLLMIAENLQMLKILPPGFDPYTRVAGYFWLILLGPSTLFAWRGMTRPGSPHFLRASLATAALFFVVAWLFAAIIEVRVLVPMVALMLPAVVHGLSEPAPAPGTVG